MPEGPRPIIAIVAIVSVIGFVSGTYGFAAFFGSNYVSANRVTVFTLGSDAQIDHAAEELAALLPFARMQAVDSLAALDEGTGDASGTVILVGHGFSTGFGIAGVAVPWRDLGIILHKGPSHTVLVAMCYSDALRDAIPEKRFLGFASLVDVDEAAFVAAASVYGMRGNLPQTEQILDDLSQIMVDKFLGVSTHPLETLAYQTKQIRGIWHVKYNDAYVDHVEYTHPDTYNHYTWIGIETSTALVGNNLIAGHIPRSSLDNALIAQAIGAALSGFGVAISVVLNVITSGIAALITLYLILVGLGMQWFVDNVVRDEGRSGWFWLQNLWVAWYGTGLDMKLGKTWWVRFQIAFGWAGIWPLWYGGKALGIDGW